MSHPCPFCNQDVGRSAMDTRYNCPCCGPLYITLDVESIVIQSFSQLDKSAIRIAMRNEWESRGRKGQPKELTIDQLKQIVAYYKPMDPVEMMDHALRIANKAAPGIRKIIPINFDNDYPYYHCDNSGDLIGLFGLLWEEGFIHAKDQLNPHVQPKLTAKAYQRLREIQRSNQESNQAFVAMWFDDSMNDVYETTIKKAIEYKEPGQTESKFKATKINDVDHLNDINDEIIGQIRRSRFMVCDLTGYRGGVYFEAGFAYGLGIPVIYTCREDWTRDEDLKDKDGKKVKELFDKNDIPIRVKKVGVHFDLAHRNRIQWSPDDLDDFRKKLEDRIKANIF